MGSPLTIAIGVGWIGRIRLDQPATSQKFQHNGKTIKKPEGGLPDFSNGEARRDGGCPAVAPSASPRPCGMVAMAPDGLPEPTAHRPPGDVR
jgi:hypothetical protein